MHRLFLSTSTTSQDIRPGVSICSSSLTGTDVLDTADFRAFVQELLETSARWANPSAVRQGGLSACSAAVSHRILWQGVWPLYSGNREHSAYGAGDYPGG